jgi:hypothetical protein
MNPGIAISPDKNTLYSSEAPSYIYKFDVSTDIMPQPLKVDSSAFFYAERKILPLIAAPKIITNFGEVWDSALTVQLGVFTPIGFVAEIPSQKAFVSANTGKITFFDLGRHYSIGSVTLSDIKKTGPVVVTADNSKMFITTNAGVKMVPVPTLPKIRPPVNVFSAGTRDGWVLESAETSGKGGTTKSTGSIIVGDDLQNKQYRSVLSFDTSKLPDNVKITKVALKVLKQGLVGTDPFVTHGNLTADIVNGYFGNAELETKDFQALASRSSIGRFVEDKRAPGWYQLILNSAHFQYVNLTGVTQFRIRFELDDNNDKGNDYVKFFAGDSTVPTASRPILIIEFTYP